MTPCLALLRWLETGGGELPPELAAHVAACPSCQTLVAAWPELRAAGQTVRHLEAPAELVAKVAAMPRLPVPCERACLAMGHVLDGEATPEARQALMDHLAQCPQCRAVWDSLAAVKQVGAATRAPASLLSRLAAVPLPRLATRKERRWRLAAAAVYILAGTVFFASGTTEMTSRKASGRIAEAFFYGRAAVTNRVRWAEKELREWLSQTQKLARDSLSRAWRFWHETIVPQDANQKPQKHVHEEEEEGRT